MRLIPLHIRKAAALPELFDQINKHLSSKRLPHFWNGGRAYSEKYELVLGAPGGIPLSIPIKLVYHQGKADEQLIDQGWRLPFQGKLSVLYEASAETEPETTPQAQAPTESEPEAPAEPEPEPPPKKSKTRTRPKPEA